METTLLKDIERKEGRVARYIEKQTSKLPSDTFLGRHSEQWQLRLH